jgi:hypothetical protein
LVLMPSFYMTLRERGSTVTKTTGDYDQGV